MVTIPTREPSEFRRGDTVKWKRAFAEYPPADGWTLTYYFATATDRESVVATDNGDGSFLVTISATASREFSEGDWQWQAVASLDGEVFTLAQGTVKVVQGFSTLGQDVGHDGRSFAKKMVDALETLLLDTAGNDEASIAIDGYQATFHGKGEMRVEYHRWKAIYDREQRAEDLAAGIGRPNSVRVRF